MSEDQNRDMQHEAELLDHDYDGIQEYDNPLPNWWLTTFFGTIIFAFIYYLHYTFGGGPTLTQELETAMKDMPKATEKVWDEGDLQSKMTPEAVAKGKAVFAAKCAACHGPEGQGVIGPNLTDKFWIHGKGHRSDIIQTITKGVTEKGMPSWSGMISDDEIMQVAGFVYFLRNTHPANPKAPQGEEAKE